MPSRMRSPQSQTEVKANDVREKQRIAQHTQKEAKSYAACTCHRAAPLPDTHARDFLSGAERHQVVLHCGFRAAVPRFYHPNGDGNRTADFHLPVWTVFLRMDLRLWRVHRADSRALCAAAQAAVQKQAAFRAPMGRQSEIWYSDRDSPDVSARH